MSDDVLALFEGIGPDGDAPTPPVPPAQPTATPPVDPGVTPPAPGGPQPPAAVDPSVAALRDAVAEIAGALPNLAHGNQPAQPQAPVDDVPLPQHQFGFTIPDQLVAALASDNPVERQQAVGAMCTTVAQNTYRETIRAIRSELQQVLPRVIGAQIQRHTQQREIFTDFFSSYQHFSDPRIRPLVVKTAQDVAAETGARAWTPQLKEAIAQRLTETIQTMAAAAQLQVGPGPAAPSAPPAPPFINGGGSRPAPSNLSAVERDIRATFDLPN